MRIKTTYYFLLLIFFLGTVKAFAWDTTAAKFYPLNIGNSYTFGHMSLGFNCDPYQTYAKHKIIITDYTLRPNGKKYYKFQNWFITNGQQPSWSYQRIDSVSMNVYAYDSVNNSDYLLDSLLAGSDNPFKGNRFNYSNLNGYCYVVQSGELFGQTRVFKRLRSTLLGPISAYYSLAEGIGFIGYSSCEVGSGESYFLTGCVIGGTVYGDTTMTSVELVGTEIPEVYSLSQNYPNPFNPFTIIKYDLPVKSRVTLTIYNALGKEIAALVDEAKNRGTYSVEFDGSDLPSGIYFYALTAGEFTITKRMILLK